MIIKGIMIKSADPAVSDLFGIKNIIFKRFMSVSLTNSRVSEVSALIFKMNTFLILSIILATLYASCIADDGSTPKVQCAFEGECLKANQTYQPPGTCTLYTCHQDGSVTGTDCGVYRPEPTCTTIPEDPTKSFPDCCEKYVC